MTEKFKVETSAKCDFVILSEAKDLLVTNIYEILRSLGSLRMTVEGTFAEALGSKFKVQRMGFGLLLSQAIFHDL
jgi:hypothetical protein